MKSLPFNPTPQQVGTFMPGSPLAARESGKFGTNRALNYPPIDKYTPYFFGAQFGSRQDGLGNCKIDFAAAKYFATAKLPSQESPI